MFGGNLAYNRVRNRGNGYGWRKTGPGDTFPSLSLKIAGGGEVVLPEAIETDFAVVLFYRGHW